MDLSYGSPYEDFRQETRRFIEAHAHLAPKGVELDREKQAGLARAADSNTATWPAPFPRSTAAMAPSPTFSSRASLPRNSRGPRFRRALGGQGIAYLRARAAGAGQRRTEAAIHRAHAARRDHLVRRLLRTECRQRPGQPEHERRPGRRRLGRQRPEDLDQHRRERRLDVLPGAHRARRAQAPGHQLPAVFHEDAGHPRAAAGDDDRRLALQRGLLHRRARAEASDRGPARARLAGGQPRVAPRARRPGRSRRHAHAAQRADRPDEERDRRRTARHRQPGVPRPADENPRPGHGHAFQRSAPAQRQAQPKGRCRWPP